MIAHPSERRRASSSNTGKFSFSCLRSLHFSSSPTRSSSTTRYFAPTSLYATANRTPIASTVSSTGPVMYTEQIMEKARRPQFLPLFTNRSRPVPCKGKSHQPGGTSRAPTSSCPRTERIDRPYRPNKTKQSQHQFLTS